MFFTRPVAVAARALAGRFTHAAHEPPTLHQRTRYPVTTPDPTDDGTLQVTFADFATGKTTPRERGSVGAPAITAAEAAVVLDLPPAFAAFTLNVYDLPLVRPSTVHERCAAAAVHVLNTEPTFGDAVTVYPLIATPPVDAGAAHDTTTDLLRGEATTDRATDGATTPTVMDWYTFADKKFAPRIGVAPAWLATSRHNPEAPKVTTPALMLQAPGVDAGSIDTTTGPPETLPATLGV